MPESSADLMRTLHDEHAAAEQDLGETYLAQSTLAYYAQALLSTNEFIFWP